MRTALIFPPYRYKSFSETIYVVDKEFCVAPPIILAYVAGILEAAGHEVILIDARVLKLSKRDVLLQLENFNPDILCFRLDTYNFHDTLEWAGYLKRALRIPVVAGGINFTFYPRESFSHPEIDYCIIGDAIDSLPRLCRALENGDKFDNIEGIGYKSKGKAYFTPPAEKVVPFDNYPFPARHLLPNEKYHSFISQKKNFTIMVTSRGCPYKCTFCTISRLPYQERTAGNVVDEIEECYHKYNIREIDIFDSIFFLNKRRVIEICREIRKRKINIEWSCRSRVDLVDDEILKEAAMSGCRQICYGIESVNREVLKNINKMINIEQVQWAVKRSHKYGIKALGFFMVGNPGDTKITVRETMAFSKKLDLDFIQISRTVAKPYTNLLEQLKEYMGYDYWREYILGNIGEMRLSSPWTTLSQSEIYDYTKKWYLSFYFRPAYLFVKILFRVKSWREFIRYTRVAVLMFFNRKKP